VLPKAVLTSPLPISAFSNTALRESVTKALAGVPAKEGNAVLEVENGGVGLMVVHRFGSGWALATGVRYSTEDHGISARVVVSWK